MAAPLAMLPPQAISPALQAYIDSVVAANLTQNACLGAADSAVDGASTLPLRVAAIFIIAIASLIGALPPVLLGSHAAVKDGRLFALLKVRRVGRIGGERKSK